MSKKKKAGTSKNDKIPIDTIHAWTQDFKWNGKMSEWDFIQSYHPVKPFEDSAAYLTARKHDSKTGWHIKKQRTYLRMEGSVSRLASNNNSQPLQVSDFPVILSYLEEIKTLLGLDFDSNSLQVARLDIFRQFDLPYPVALFIKKLSQIYRLPHLVQRASSELYGFSYVRWENQGREIVLYDKSESFRTGSLLNDRNVIRAEVRFLRTHICKREGIIDLHSLMDTQHLFKLWSVQFHQLLNESKKLAVIEPSIFKGDLANILENTIRSNGFRVNHLVKVVAGVGGIDKLLEFMGGEKGFDLWLNSQNLHRQKRSRIRKTIQELNNLSTQFHETPLQVDVLVDLKDWLER